MTGIKIFSSIEDRFPSRKEALLVMSACIFPIHIWITIVFLYNFPSLILRANIWQILGVLAFALIFAFFESLVLFGFLVLLAALLPRRFFRERFVYLGTLLALVIPGFALLVNTQFMHESSWAWIPVIGLTAAGLFASLRRPVDDSRQTVLAERFTLISSLYFVLDMLALLYLVGSMVLL
ncbi:MAG: hypothetical protein JJE12_09420 [Anaerolineales bacterium]|nr:hypothetical protein [Anaerolineales bacterium]